MKTAVVCFMMAVAVAKAAKLPDGFKLCHKADADYDECLKQAAMTGINLLSLGDKTLGVNSLDPLDVEHVHIPGNGGSVDLEQTYIHMVMHGLGVSTVNNFKVDMEGSNCHLYFESLTPKLELNGDYKATGKMLLFTLNGDGPFTITSTNLKVTHNIECEKYQKKGKEHVKVTNYKLELEPDTLSYDFKNLINGNEQLSTEVLKVMNDNPLEIFKELKNDYSRTFGEFFKIISNQLFSKIPGEVFFS